MATQNSNEHHVTPAPVLIKTFAALIVLTVLTVVAARLHLGAFAAPVAFLIATVKAILVMAFFMGLKYDVKLTRIILVTGFFFLALLLFFTALDIFTRPIVTSTL